jgi:hypothetical protein
MPTFDFTAPDGKSYSVEGPEGATSEQAFQILQSQLGGQKSAAPSTGIGEDLAGVAKAAPGRLVAGLAGLPGDLLHAGMRALGDNLTPESGYGSHAISKALGSDYEAKTEPGRITQKAIDFAPAVIGGPEAMGAKLLTRVAAPVAASEVGRQVAGPYGEVAGALAGAASASTVAQRFNAAAKARSAAVPTVDELKNAARTGYKSADVEAVRINPGAVDNLAATIENDLAGQGFRPKGQAGVFDVVGELRGAPGPVAVADLDAARKALGVIAKEKDAVGQATANATAARRAISHIDDFLPNLSQADLLAGDAAKANQILGEARQNWGAAKRSEQVQNLRANAEINAAAANSGQNIQNATKQAFKPLLKNNYAKAAGFDDAEKAALNRVVRGDWLGGAARFGGNLLGGGGGLGMLAGGVAGYEAGGAPGAIAAGLAGKGLKSIGNRATFNAVSRLDVLLRSRSPAALQLAAQLPPQVIAQLPKKSAAILAAMSAQPIFAQPVPANR